MSTNTQQNFSVFPKLSPERKVWLVSQLYLLGKELEKLNDRKIYEPKNERTINSQRFTLRNS